MKVRDVQIDGFGVWSGLSVDSLPDGMTVFYGPNEAGKTTLMNFLRTMFYGFTAERRQRYLPPVHGGKPGGAIRVTGPGGGYEIARRATLNDPSIIGQLTVTSSDGITQGQHRLTSLLGNIDESIFTNVFAIGLRELQELSTLDDTAAADELYKLSSGLDRVSLVDVIRQLRTARTQLVSTNVETTQLPTMMMRREKLRDEIEQLTIRGRRWGEFAVLRRNQQNEIDELKQRIEQWELEGKTIEIALQVREPWTERDQVRNRLKSLHARVDLPDNALEKLREIQDQIDDKRRQIQSIIEQRKQLRAKANQLPASKNILSLASKIEAAGEQGPWITQLQKQIQRLESELQETRQQLLEDAKRLGLSEQDQQDLLNDKRLANLPDLSRQAISQLAGPARDVRTHQLRLKQAKERGINDKKESEQLQAEIAGFLSVRETDDLQVAIKNASERIQTLRKHQQIEERLDKLTKHRREIEGEAVELESDDGFSWERVLMLSIPFFVGAIMFVTGINNFFGWYATKAQAINSRISPQQFNEQIQSDQNQGVLMTVLGTIVLVGTYLWWKSMERGSRGDITDAESQLEAILLQIRKAENERDEIARSLPDRGGSIDQQLKEAEHELAQCEGLLPVFHNYQAARQRFQTARQQSVDAAHGLKSARHQWKKTLAHLGLAESLSPKSIRVLADGYESLLQTRRRLKAQGDELDQRRIELASAIQKIEAISTQLQVAIDEANRDDGPRSSNTLIERVDRTRDDQRSQRDNHRDRDSNRERRERRDLQRLHDDTIALRDASANTSDFSVEAPQQKLQELTSTLAQHQQYLAQKKELKSEDEEMGRKQKSLRRLMERWVRARQAHLAELGVENQEQLEQQIALKAEHLKLERDGDALEQRIRSTIGGNVPYEAIGRLLENTPANELEKRWDTLGSRVTQAEERISQLLQRQGETSQEMKGLAADRRLAEAKLELACLEKQIQGCADHWRTLGATTCMLEKVCEVYENERQPETLREASTFLKQLTEGKYVRVWTPLGKNALRIDNDKGQSLPLEVLSRGTREAVFISLRLSLAAAYSRRGVTLPLVLDDVLVNFDTIRATSAAKVLRDFASLGHQVIMFTCHEHIMKLFDAIGVQVRVLPAQGQIGEAKIYQAHDVVIEAPPAAKPIALESKPEVVVPPAAPIVLPPTVVEPVAVEMEKPAAIVLPSEPILEEEFDEVESIAPDIITIRPNTKPIPMRIVDDFEEETIETDSFWYDEPIEEEAESHETTARLWTEIDRLEMPLEGEPHDSWWSEKEDSSTPWA